MLSPFIQDQVYWQKFTLAGNEEVAAYPCPVCGGEHSPFSAQNPTTLPFALSSKASAPVFSLHSSTPGLLAGLVHAGHTHTHDIHTGYSPVWMLFPHIASWPNPSSRFCRASITSLRPLLIAPAPQDSRGSFSP